MLKLGFGHSSMEGGHPQINAQMLMFSIISAAHTSSIIVDGVFGEKDILDLGPPIFCPEALQNQTSILLIKLA